MNFYASIASLYDHIFPLSKEQVLFTSGTIPNINDSNLLDIGCGTGNLTLAIGEKCKSIVGIDLDEEMIQLAKQKLNANNVCFDRGNMLKLTDQFATNNFDGIVCYGNTLVHLQSMEEIEKFTRECYTVLKPKGKLLIQIINYDRILNKNINYLPTIENDYIKFERNYDYLEEVNKINFKTILSDKAQNQTIKNEQLLYPLREKELVSALSKNGFIVSNRFGNFNKVPISTESVPLILEAEKE